MLPQYHGIPLDFRKGPGNTKVLNVEGLATDTHLHQEAWHTYFSDYPHQRLLQMCEEGVTFQDSLEWQIVICPNLHSLYDCEGGIDAVADEMHQLCHDRGWYLASDTGC